MHLQRKKVCQAHLENPRRCLFSVCLPPRCSNYYKTILWISRRRITTYVALSCDASLDNIIFLLNDFPQGAQITAIQDYDGKLPQHIACGMNEG